MSNFVGKIGEFVMEPAQYIGAEINESPFRKEIVMCFITPNDDNIRITTTSRKIQPNIGSQYMIRFKVKTHWESNGVKITYGSRLSIEGDLQ